jgi:hypothetical protein
MTERKELGKITHANFGWGGYQDVMFGLSLQFSGSAWGCGDFKGAWGVAWTESCKWTEEDRLRDLGKTCMFLKDLMTKAKVKSVEDLVGVPVEVTFDGNTLRSWRVLEEVL